MNTLPPPFVPPPVKREGGGVFTSEVKAQGGRENTLLNILLAQVNPTVGAIRANAAIVRDLLDRHRDAADLIVLPELFLCGYPPEDLILKPAFLDAVEVAVHDLRAGVTGRAALVLSVPWRMEGGVFNALLLIEDGAITAIVPKHHLPDYGVFDETRVFTPGPLPAPVPFRGQLLGLMTCEDMWHADAAAALAERGAAALIVINASPYESGKAARRLDLARARTAETGLPLVYLNMAGGQDELVFDGASFGINADGDIAFRMKAFDTDTCLIEFTPPPLHSPSRKQEGGKWKAGEIAPAPDGCAALYEALKTGLRDYVTKNGFRGVLIGLSGGIDSALAAVIAAEALGPHNVTCVMMPSPYTSSISLEDAAALAKTLGVAYRVIPIEGCMDGVDALLGAEARTGVTPENIQSRLRGMILMALSNAHGLMVVATGNKSEMATGYATLYGDMCGGFAVLKDVYKTRVFALCRWLNARGDNPVMPDRIITRPPSAELRDNQTDQDSLPPYEVLDAILAGLIEEDLGPTDLIARGFDRATVQRVARLLDGAEYKRRQAAPGVKVTSRAFGRDRRVPITSGILRELLENPE